MSNEFESDESFSLAETEFSFTESISLLDSDCAYSFAKLSKMCLDAHHFPFNSFRRKHL